MKIAVFSDTHGSVARMMRAVREVGPDVLVHLGDYVRDTDCLKSGVPKIPLYQVAGNCDIGSSVPQELVVEFGPVRALLCHGHRYAVDWGRLDSMVYSAQEKDCSLVLFGHTHCAENTEIGGVKLINPGTAGKGTARSFALVEIFENGGITAEIRLL